MAFKMIVSDLGFDCRRAWLWGKTYSDKEPSEALWVGTGVHKALEAWFKEKNIELAQKSLRSWADSSITRVARATGDHWPDIREKFLTAKDFCSQLVASFGQYVQDTGRYSGEVVAVEEKLTYPIAEGINLVGKIDLVIRTRSGHLHLIDHKTFSKPPSYQTLDIDEQLTAYAFLWWKVHGEIPSVISYNVVYKNLPQEPTLLKNGQLSQAKSQVTTPALYRQAILKNGLRMLDYTDFLKYLEGQGWNPFFDMLSTSRNKEELELFHRFAIAKAQDLQRTTNQPELWAYTLGSVYRCGYCSFVIPCKLKNEGSDYQSVLDAQFSTDYLY